MNRPKIEADVRDKLTSTILELDVQIMKLHAMILSEKNHDKKKYLEGAMSAATRINKILRAINK